MRGERTSPGRRVLWAAALLLFMLALGSCSADGTLAPDRSGARAALTLTQTPAPQATLTSAASTPTPNRRATVTPARTPKRKATATLTYTPTRKATVAPTPTSARRATATPMVALSGLPTIPYDRLPSQARETIALIQAGGPFPYRQDSSVFQNRERLLPAKPSGYYHEYTVKTPGSPDRGARRIITGEKGELYFTDDHYDSFRQVVTP